MVSISGVRPSNWRVAGPVSVPSTLRPSTDAGPRGPQGPLGPRGRPPGGRWGRSWRRRGARWRGGSDRWDGTGQGVKKKQISSGKNNIAAIAMENLDRKYIYEIAGLRRIYLWTVFWFHSYVWLQEGSWWLNQLMFIFISQLPIV